MTLNDKALEYHAQGRPGKIKVVPTKSCVTAEDLSLGYSPGVAAPCLAIDKDPEALEHMMAREPDPVMRQGIRILLQCHPNRPAALRQDARRFARYRSRRGGFRNGRPRPKDPTRPRRDR